MQQRAFDNPRIEFAWNTAVVDVVGDTKVEALALRDTQPTGSFTEIDLPGADIDLPIERPLHRPAIKPKIADIALFSRLGLKWHIQGKFGHK